MGMGEDVCLATAPQWGRSPSPSSGFLVADFFFWEVSELELSRYNRSLCVSQKNVSSNVQKCHGPCLGLNRKNRICWGVHYLALDIQNPLVVPGDEVWKEALKALQKRRCLRVH